jgi:hypothetical protein
MKNENKDVEPIMGDGNISTPPSPAIGEPQSPVMGGMDLVSLRRMYGDSYGTSGLGVINTVPDLGSTNNLTVLTWINECQKAEGDPKVLMEQGLGILRQGFADFNSLKHLFGKYNAKWSIRLGELLLGQKELTRRAEMQWGQWAAEHLPFIGKRTRETFMHLAKRTDCHQYAFLGVERLDVLCSATKALKGADRIGDFMARHGIIFNPAEEFNLDEFKQNVDAALGMDRLLHNELPADPEVVKALTVAGKEVDGKLIRKMKEIQGCGGSTDAYLRNLTLTSADGTGTLDDEDQKAQDFNSLSNRLIETIDYLMTEREEEIEKVDPDTFVKLLRKLGMLQKLTPIKLKSEKAA